ncbi:MAPEG family protein [Aspergillus stella-maris]|uniref:MAPEG family protein n=1 Tax=Aspergillus stella-maris TaxID=1810926 RepID=UPI003CCE1C08
MSTTNIPGLLQPVIALNGWTFVMEIWMYATRLPAFGRIKEATDPSTLRSEIDRQTPPSVRWKADNFNHLFEQPTQFYAVTLALAIARQGKHNATDLKLAWAYVGLRILHSFIQSTSNKIMLRFGVFAISSSVLAVLTGRAALLAF